MELRRCPVCNENKEICQFPTKATGKIIGYCINCKRQKARDHYKANPQPYKDRRKARKEVIREMVRKAKERPCADCKVQYPYWIMQFDHLGDKKFDLAKALEGTESIDIIINEIGKCDITCANCHADRTYKRSIYHEPGLSLDSKSERAGINT